MEAKPDGGLDLFLLDSANFDVWLATLRARLDELASTLVWAPGQVVAEGRILFISGQVAWDEKEQFHSDDIVDQVLAALKMKLTGASAQKAAPARAATSASPLASITTFAISACLASRFS